MKHKFRYIFITNCEELGGPRKVCERLYGSALFEKKEIIYLGKNDKNHHNPRNFFQLYKYMLKKQSGGLKCFLCFGTKESLYVAIIKTLIRDKRNIYIVRTGTLPNYVKNSQKKFFKKYLQPFLCKLIYRCFHKIVTETTGLKKSWIRTYPNKAKDIQHIKNPVRELTTTSEREKLRKIYFGKKIIVNIGRLSNQKNQDMLLKSFAALDSSIKKRAVLILIGTGPEKSHLIQLSKHLGLQKNVVFVGNIENVADYLSICDLYCLTSKWEGAANSLIEATVMNCTIVSTDCPIGPREILENYHSYTLVNPHDIKELTIAIQTALTKNKITIKNPQTEQYGLNKISKDYLELIHEY